MKNYLIFTVFLFLITSISHAGVLLEPYIGFQVNNAEDSNATKTDYSWANVALGGKVGYQFLGFMAGGMYEFAPMNFDVDVTSGTSKYTIESQSKGWGFFAGYEFPILLRAYGTYFLKKEIRHKQANSAAGIVSGDEFCGTGMGFGVGYTGLPFISINAEYRMYTYDEQKSGTTGIDTALTGTNEIDGNEIFINVSLPFDL